MTEDINSSEPGSPWYVTGWGIFVITNALLGLAAFEWAWYRTHRFRKPNEELNKVFNMFSRSDAPKWTKWKFYPGAVTILLPRLLIGIAFAFILLIVVSVLLIGHKRNDPI